MCVYVSERVQVIVDLLTHKNTNTHTHTHTRTFKGRGIHRQTDRQTERHRQINRESARQPVRHTQKRRNTRACTLAQDDTQTHTQKLMYTNTNIFACAHMRAHKYPH